jgi:hypothetical protein
MAIGSVILICLAVHLCQEENRRVEQQRSAVRDFLRRTGEQAAACAAELDREEHIAATLPSTQRG